MQADELIRARFEASIQTKQALLAGEHVAFTRECAELIAASYRNGGRLLICGNGGSAADAMHLAAEFVGRYLLDRGALSAISLSDSQSGITCIGNDYSFDEIFARAVRAHGREGDVFLGITTSGNSPNVVEAALAAKELGLRTVGMTGAKGGRIAEVTELCLRVPSDETPRIQEGYMLVGHTVCELVEASLFA